MAPCRFELRVSVSAASWAARRREHHAEERARERGDLRSRERERRDRRVRPRSRARARGAARRENTARARRRRSARGGAAAAAAASRLRGLRGEEVVHDHVRDVEREHRGRPREARAVEAALSPRRAARRSARASRARPRGRRASRRRRACPTRRSRARTWARGERKGAKRGRGISLSSRAKTARTDGAPSALGPGRHAEQDLRAEAEHRRGDGRDADRVAADPPEILRGEGGLSFVVLPETASRARAARARARARAQHDRREHRDDDEPLGARERAERRGARARASPFAAGVAVTVGGWR